MAAVRAFADATTGRDQWSLSRGFKDYLSCCFVSTASGSAPAAEGKMQAATVTDKNANDEAACDVAEDACKADAGCATSADGAECKQADEPDGKTGSDQHSDDLSTSCRMIAENDVAGRDGCVDSTSLSSSALAGLDRRSADGASVESAESEGFRSRSGSGSGLRNGSNRELMNGSISGGSGRTAADETMAEMDDGSQIGAAPRRGSASQISIGDGSTSTIARYNGTSVSVDLIALIVRLHAPVMPRRRTSRDFTSPHSRSARRRCGRNFRCGICRSETEMNVVR
jgi:hypothetical protein